MLCWIKGILPWAISVPSYHMLPSLWRIHTTHDELPHVCSSLNGIIFCFFIPLLNIVYSLLVLVWLWHCFSHGINYLCFCEEQCGAACGSSFRYANLLYCYIMRLNTEYSVQISS